MHTEVEANQTWCPFASAPVIMRTGNGSGQSIIGSSSTAVSANRVENAGRIGIPPACICLASKCAAWRWSGEFKGDRPTGYCGAGGPPRAKPDAP